MGNTLSYGKYYYSSVYGTSSPEAITTLEMYHYHGDPTMEIWTAAPSNLTVSHAGTATAGDTSFTVNVSQGGALVSIVQNGVILAQLHQAAVQRLFRSVPVSLPAQPTSPSPSTTTVPIKEQSPSILHHLYQQLPATSTATPVSQTQIDLGWADNSNNESGFTVERSPNGTSGWTQIATVGANVTTYSSTGLTCSTTYYYRVRAYNGGGDSDYSNTVNAATVVCTPAAPSNLTAIAGSQTRINLAWTDNSSNESGFKIERSPNGATWTPVYTTTANVAAYSDIGLTCGSTYFYRVRAYNTSGDSDYSNVAGSTTVVCVPAPPSDLTATPVSQTQINLAWADNSTNESGFKIERSPNGTSDWTQIVAVGANVTTYNNTGVNCDTTYYYRVRAYNAGGDSNYSNTANATTVVCAVAAPAT